MRTAAVALLIGAVASGCAGGGQARRPDSQASGQGGAGAETPATAERNTRSGGQTSSAGGSEASGTYVDAQHGFTIERPDGSWSFLAGDELSSGAIEVPLVVSNESATAQVVVQVAPAVATPAEFAERLTLGLRSRAGFGTGEVAPIPLAEGAVGFDFDAGGQVKGRVAILEGAEGRVFVLLGTWPEGSQELEAEVDRILSSMKAEEPTEVITPPAQ